MEWEPPASVEMVTDAVPMLRGEKPMTLAPSFKVTVPVAAGLDSVAVNRTPCPGIEGFGSEARLTITAAWFTVWVRTDDVLGAQLTSPV